MVKAPLFFRAPSNFAMLDTVKPKCLRQSHSSLLMASAPRHSESKGVRQNVSEASRFAGRLENRSKPRRFAYSSMKAAPIITVGKMAHRNNFTAEIPSSPNRETKID